MYTLHFPLLQYTLSLIHSPVYTLHYTLSSVHSPFPILRYTLSLTHSPVHTLHYTVCSPVYASPVYTSPVYTLQNTLSSIPSLLYILHYTLSPRSTLYTINFFFFLISSPPRPKFVGITLFTQYYSVICPPSDHNVGRPPPAEI